MRTGGLSRRAVTAWRWRCVLGVAAVVTTMAVAMGAAATGLELSRQPLSSGAVADTILYSATGGLYTVRADGSHRRRIVSGAAGEAVWSPDGRQIAYTLGMGDETSDVWIARADGTGARRVTSHPRLGLDLAPSWSPDGRRIVFHREWYRNDDHITVDLYTVDVATRRIERLTRSPDDWEHDPAWSPDGRRIAYAKGNAADDDGIYLLDPATGRARRLTRISYNDRMVGFDHGEPDWSADGRHIAYSLQSYRHERAIIVMDADGSHRRRIIISSAGVLAAPSWSPDGSRIAYWATFGRADERGLRPWAVFIARADGRRPRRIIGGAMPDWKPPVAAPTRRGAG